MYFCATTNMSGQTLKPRIPTFRMKNENEDIKRVCASESIDGCLVAIGGFQIGDTIYVHTCVGPFESQSPTIEQVLDVPFTGEKWITTDVLLEGFLEIEITEVVERSLFGMALDTYIYKIVNPMD